MQTDIPKLPITELIFRYKTENSFKLSGLTGSLWHGVFGKALKEISCCSPGLMCADCMFLHSCDYSYLFAGIRPPQAELMTKYQTIPVPYVFRTEQVNDEIQFSAEQILEVPLILIGDSSQRLSVVLHAMHKAGLNGLGRDRKRIQLMQVVQKVNQQTQVILGEGGNKGLLPWQEPRLPAAPQAVVLKLITPYKLSGDAKQPDSIDIGKFLMQIIRRISLLQYFYTAQQLNADFVYLKTLTENIVAEQDITYKESKRYSASHGKVIDTSGFVGVLKLSMLGKEDLWPYIYLGQWLHVGKNASMGFGRYEVVEVD